MSCSVCFIVLRVLFSYSLNKMMMTTKSTLRVNLTAGSAAGTPAGSQQLVADAASKASAATDSIKGLLYSCVM